MDKEKYFNYRTGPVNLLTGDVIDTSKTGMSFYDDLLPNGDPEYMRDEHNLVAHIEYMTPNEYYKQCSLYGFPGGVIPVEKLKQERRIDKKTLEHLKDVLTDYGHKFPIPFVNKAERGQEGLHRMMVLGDMFGWDKGKYPVLVITWADEDRAKRDKQARIDNDIRQDIKSGVQKALHFTYYNIEEFKEQLQYSLDSSFEFSDYVKTPVQFTLTDGKTWPEEDYAVTVNNVSYEFEKSSVKLKEPQPVDDDLNDVDIDIDDIELDELDDFEDTEDFLKRYFGDNWRETNPELKKTFGIKESKSSNILSELQNELNKFDYAFIDKDGNELDDESAMDAVVQSPEQLSKLGKGVCTDYVEYSKKWLDSRGIEYSTYDISFVDEDGDEPSHIAVVAHIDGKYIWIENSWYSEKGNHVYNSLESFFKDIANKHCVWDNNNYLSSCVIREFDKSLAGMSQQQVYDYMHTLPITWKPKENLSESVERLDIKQMDKAILAEWGATTPGDGCIFIHPSGTFINIYPKLDDHEDLCYWLEEEGFGDNPEDPAWFVDEFKYIRCRNNLHLCFIELPTEVTRQQLRSLAEWMETKVSTDFIDIEAPNGEWKHYNLDEYFPEDLIKIIRRFYSSGKLYEDISDIKYRSVSNVEKFKQYANDILGGYGNLSDEEIRNSKEIIIDDKLAGYIGFSTYEKNGHKCLGIGNFMIIERGKGLGSAVIRDIVEKYKNQYDLIYCFVDAENQGAIKLYKKLGKVYDEGGPNDNGEYYVTFWDNGKWELDEEFDHVNLSDIKRSWSKETAHPTDQKYWSEEKPSLGQCAVTAIILK